MVRFHTLQHYNVPTRRAINERIAPEMASIIIAEMPAPVPNRENGNKVPTPIGHKLEQIKLPRNTDRQLYVEMPAQMIPERISLITLYITLTRIILIYSTKIPFRQKGTYWCLQ